MTSELNSAKQAYNAWKDRCQHVEERLATNEKKLNDYRVWHNENEDMVKFGKKDLDRM